MNLKRISLAATCIAMNVVLAKVANVLNLPLYLDTPGTILAAVLLPGFWAVGVGAGTSIVGALTINGVWIYYVGTQVVLALAAILTVRYRFFVRWWTALLAGVILGVIAVVVSAPVTVIVFGGVTVPGPTAINAVLLATGRSLWESVIAGSLIIEMLDKPIAAFLSWLILMRLPRNLLGK